MYICKCGKEFESIFAYSGHKGNCSIANPNYVPFSKRENFDMSKFAWSKGLTKETSESLKKLGESVSKATKNKPRPKLTKETKQKLSIVMKEKYGKNPPKVAGRSKCGWYKGFYCRSSWELAYLIYHLEHNIKIESVSTGFKYVWEGYEHTYFPDFYLPDNDTYIEIKGYYSKQAIEKTKQFKGNLQLLRYNELKKYLDYTINKYGDNFISLYESTVNIHNAKKEQRCKELEANKKRRQQEKELQIEPIRQQLLNSDIDFSKYGWVGKASKIIGITPQKVHQWMRKNMLEFYNTKCFQRNMS